jgi:hypothetical protein
LYFIIHHPLTRWQPRGYASWPLRLRCARCRPLDVGGGERGEGAEARAADVGEDARGHEAQGGAQGGAWEWDVRIGIKMVVAADAESAGLLLRFRLLLLDPLPPPPPPLPVCPPSALVPPMPPGGYKGGIVKGDTRRGGSERPGEVGYVFGGREVGQGLGGQEQGQQHASTVRDTYPRTHAHTHTHTVRESALPWGGWRGAANCLAEESGGVAGGRWVGETLEVVVGDTGGWAKFEEVDVGVLHAEVCRCL